MQDTYLNGVDIKVEPFDLTYTGETYKLDLLFYNDINRHGEILSSLVYNSGIRAIADITLIVYNPNKLFLNTTFETGYTITGTSNRWKNADLLTNGLTNFRDNSAGADHSAYDTFNIATDYAVAYHNGEHAYDGWYTIYSIALQAYPDNSAGVLQGTFRSSGSTVQYALIDSPINSGNWSNLDTIDSTIDIYNFMREDRGDTYLSYDFVPTVKINSLNKRLLDNKLDNGWFKRINILNPKLRTLETAIEFNEYDKAQYMINAVNNSLLSLLI